MAGCDDGAAPGGSPPPGEAPDLALALEPVATGLQRPLHLTAPADDPRLFVVEQVGRIRVVRDGTLLPTPFLDVTDRVVAGGERGLLSLAFDPQYAASGLFWVAYTRAGGDVVVARFRVGADPDRADPASEREVLVIPQPFANHNGGHVLFGPDGYLWVGTGDGGSGGDPRGNGQSTGTLLGKLLRLDVKGGDPYAVPPDNPLVGRPGARPEIWAWGLRNPWRVAFDPAEGTLYVADVGQNEVEEVNVVEAGAAGLNYGWNVMEGDRCYEASSCDREGLTLPALTYDHGDGCSVTGGLVYRGRAIPALRGHYLYADYCGGWVRSFRWADGEAVESVAWDGLGTPGHVLSFGEDAAGEVYLLVEGGTVYRFVVEG